MSMIFSESVKNQFTKIIGGRDPDSKFRNKGREAEIEVPKLYGILGGRGQNRSPGCDCGLAQPFGIGLRIRVMVAEGTGPGKFCTGLFERLEEVPRIAEPAKSECRCRELQLRLDVAAKKFGELNKAGDRAFSPKKHRILHKAPELAFKRGKIGSGTRLGDDNGVGPAEVRGRFAKPARGQKFAAGEGIGRVNANDVEAAGGTAMLEAIVKHKAGHAEFFSRKFCRGDAVTVGDNDDLAFQPAGEFDRFIAAGFGIGEHGGAIGDDNARGGIAAAVTACEDANAFAARDQHLGNESDDRRFARSAYGDVSDTDRRSAEVFGRKPSAVVKRVAEPGSGRIRPTEWRKCIHQSSRKLRSIVLPCSVRIDSG